MFEKCLAVPPERDPHRPWSSLRGCFSWRCSGHRGHRGCQHGMFDPFAKRKLLAYQKRHRKDYQDKQFKKTKTNDWNPKNPTWCRQNWKQNRKQRRCFAVFQNVTLWFTESIYRPLPHLFFRNVESGERKKVGFVLLPSTEYSPTSTTISCVPVWRLQSAHLHSECALFPVGHGKHLRELPYCNYQFFDGSRWFQASWKYSILKIRNLLFPLALHIPNKSLETPLVLPWVHWDEHPAVLSNLVPQPGASMNAPYFPQRC